MEHLPLAIPIVFVLTTLVALLLFLRAVPKPAGLSILLVSWLLLQAMIASTGFYTATDAMPPRLLVAVALPLVSIVLCFTTTKGKAFIDGLDIGRLSLVHLIRIPVELLFITFLTYKLIPEIMTFEGKNLDILSGITCLPIYYWGYIKKRLSKNVLLIWNFVCIGLLINIVSIAILSAPFQFQQFGFEQPNIIILYAPYVWLPCCIVPLVLFTHLVSIRDLLKPKVN